MKVIPKPCKTSSFPGQQPGSFEPLIKPYPNQPWVHFIL
jgi:hypothetical protein